MSATSATHVALIRGCMALLAAGGELFFSTNLRSFRMDTEALAGLDLADISEQTIPPDFRNRRIHKCWHVRQIDEGCVERGRST